MSRLAGKVALVTGASTGIGAGIAKNLGTEGATVVVNYATSREGADRTVAEIVKGAAKLGLFKVTSQNPRRSHAHSRKSTRSTASWMCL